MLLLTFTLLLVTVAATVVHEVGHLLAATVFGQQVSSFNPFSEVVLANPPPPNVATIFNFSGGLFSAFVFGLASLELFRKPRGPSLFWLGIPLLFATILELSNGLVEGFYKNVYIVANLLYPSTYGFFLAAWAASVSLLFAVVGYYFACKSKRQSLGASAS